MDELLNLARMARRVGVTQLWLREQADDGVVPCLKADSRYLFNPEAVQEALSAKAAHARVEREDANARSVRSQDSDLLGSPRLDEEGEL